MLPQSAVVHLWSVSYSCEYCTLFILCTLRWSWVKCEQDVYFVSKGNLMLLLTAYYFCCMHFVIRFSETSYR